jgi:hypothetical protein
MTPDEKASEALTILGDVWGLESTNGLYTFTGPLTLDGDLVRITLSYEWLDATEVSEIVAHVTTGQAPYNL